MILVPLVPIVPLVSYLTQLPSSVLEAGRFVGISATSDTSPLPSGANLPPRLPHLPRPRSTTHNPPFVNLPKNKKTSATSPDYADSLASPTYAISPTSGTGGFSI